MRSTHLRQADLNLLVVFTAVAEERNITRAASRLLLSQPAVTRALQRLRDTFHDDLLIRTSTGYEPTPKGQRLLQDLATMLPRLDRLMAGGDFDPSTEDASFRIAATDHAAYLLVPPLYTSVLPKRTKVDFSFVPLHAGQYEALEKGRLDLVLNADHDTSTFRLSKEVIFEVDFVCVVSRKSKFERAITVLRAVYFESNDAESEEVATMPIEARRCAQNFLLSDQERNQVGGLSANWKLVLNGRLGGYSNHREAEAQDQTIRMVASLRNYN